MTGLRVMWRLRSVLCVGTVVVVGICVLAGCAEQSADLSASPAPAAWRPLTLTDVAHAVPAPGTFVSLLPACACGRHTELDEFSMASGRKLRRLARLTVPGYERLDTPAAASDGRLFFTLTRDVLCADTGTFAECPKYEPNSCRNEVSALAPGGSRLRPLFTIPGSRTIGQAVPDPAGGRVALTMGPCFSVHGTAGLYVRSLATGAMRAIATSRNICDSFSPVAWNTSGTQLAFVYQRAGGPAGIGAEGLGCPEGREFVAIAAARATSGRHRLKLIAPTPGCAFGGVAFDASGLVAVQGCDHGDPVQNDGNNHLGQAYLVQYTPGGHVVRRFPLRLGLEESVLAHVPQSTHLLVTFDQPANQPYPERDWVWDFDGSRLRLIAHYKANDAAQVLAVPW